MVSILYLQYTQTHFKRKPHHPADSYMTGWDDWIPDRKPYRFPICRLIHTQ